MSSSSNLGPNWIYTPSTTGGSFGGTVTSPAITTTGTSSGYGFYNTASSMTISATEQRYRVMTLPNKRVPSMVYANGRLLTFGILGSDCECAYAGKGKLVFSPGAFAVSIYGRMSVSLQYKTKIYHYSIKYSDGIALDCQLLSEVTF